MGSRSGAADDEAEQRAERAAAEQPVVHDDEPADADHGSPAESEVVGGAELAGESVHEVVMTRVARIIKHWRRLPALRFWLSEDHSWHRKTGSRTPKAGSRTGFSRVSIEISPA